jgi:hypothetical protein
VNLGLTDGSYVAGHRLQWEFAGSLTPAKNGDGSYTTPTQTGVGFIDGDSWARLSLALGYASPSGPYAFHCAVLTDNEDTGAVTINGLKYDRDPWSNDFTDTVNAASAQWSSANKSSFVSVSGVPALTATGNAGVNAAENVFADSTKTGKRWFEITLGAMDANALFLIGFDDGSRTGVQNFFTPGGSGNTAGACLVINNAQINANGGAAQSGVTNSAGQTGDVFRCEIDDVAKTVSFFRTRSGTTLQCGSTQAITLAVTPYRACAAPFSPTTSNVLVGNFGQSPATNGATAGFNPYG